MKITLLVACCCWMVCHVQAADSFRAAGPRPLPNFDQRRVAPAVPEHKSGGQGIALAELQQRDPLIQVEFDGLLGTPILVTKANGFLGNQSATNRRLAPAMATPPGPEDPAGPVKAFLDENVRLFGHGSEVLTGARQERDDVTRASGLRTVVWQQQLDGLPVFGARLAGHMTKKGELVRLSSRFLPQIEQAAEGELPQRAALIAHPTVSAPEAVVDAAANIGDSIRKEDVAEVADESQPPDKRQAFQTAALKGRTWARLVWLPMNRSRIRLCWQIELTGRARPQLYRLLIDAQTGKALLRHCLTSYASDATYRVFTSDSPTPFSPGHRVRSSQQPAEVSRQLITLSALSTNASPNGWIDPGLNELHGNNVDAHLDRNDDDTADLPRTHGSPTRVFDFPLNLAQAPTASGDAAVTEIFYWCNWMHDRLYDLGFTEAAGNFQKQNFNRGGLGNDAIEADGQDGGDFNNANFSTPEDGLPGRLQLYLFNGANPNRDGDLDTEVLLHELTHGLSSRLVGSGAGITALQSAGMGEGWSDFYGLALLSQESDEAEGNYAFGGYSTYEMSGLTENYYFGIRRYPYSSDLTRNPLTFRDIDPRQADRHATVPLSPLFESWNPADEVHSIGELWCVVLWEARANLIKKWGFTAGNQLILELVTDGMKLTPPDPNFLQARDALLQADLVKTGGANREELWRGFAKRGLGFSATSPPSDWTEGVTESFDVPDDLLVSPNVAFAPKGPEGGLFEPASQVFVLSNVGTNTVQWTATKRAGWLNLSLEQGSLSVGAQAVHLTASLNGAADALPRGTYRDAITFTNHVTGRSQVRQVVLRVGQPDYFTQLFAYRDNPLDNQTFTFTPDGSDNFYSVCREAAAGFPTDPQLGTVLQLGDESSAELNLSGGAQVALYGIQSSALWLGANGCITFHGAASEFVESLATHFSGPRISMLFSDLDPTEDGRVSWGQLEDRVVITFEDVPSFYELNRNSFQAELFFDGRIRLTYLGVDTTGGLVGLSRGGGEPADFENSDFLKFGPCQAALYVTGPAVSSENDGSLMGSVEIAAALDHELIVRLKSLEPGTLAVPASVTLPAGARLVAFPLLLANNTELDGTKVVRVIASADGFRDSSTRIQVRDDEMAVLTVLIPVAAREGDGLLRGSGTVTVAPVPSQSVVVHLTSSHPNKVEPGGVVVIPAGQSSAPFDLQIKDDSEIDGRSAVRLTAHVDNWVDGTALITVLDNERADLTVRVRSQVAENSGVLLNAGTVLLSGTLDHDLAVSLVSSDPSRISIPSSVTIRQGETNTEFDLTVTDNSQIDGPRAITILAQAPGFTEGKADVRVNDDETPPIPSSPQPADRSTNVPPSVVLSWGTGQGEILLNGGFETGDLSGWSQENSGDGSFVLHDGSLDPAGPEEPSLPFAGNFSVTTEQLGPGRLVLFQEVTLPAGALSAVLSWQDRIRNHSSLYAEPDQQYRVEIRTAANQLLATAFSTSTGFPLRTDWTRRSFDLEAYIGQTIRIAFVVQATFGYFNVQLDEVSLWLGQPLPTSYDVHFGTDPAMGTGSSLGNTATNRWALSELEIGKSYFWSVVASRGAAQSAGPVWQFRVAEVGPVDHFVWDKIPSPQLLDVPFPVRLVAQDTFGNTATNFSGTVALGAAIEFPDTPIGTGTDQWEYPLGVFFSDSRTQVLYLPNEIGLPRRLTALAVYVKTPRGAPLNRFTLRMKHSPLRNYPKTAVWERTGWTVVYQGKQNLDQRGWVVFKFSTPFQYDGVSSLLVDFSDKDSAFASGGGCASSLTDQPRALSYQSYGYEGDPLGWSGSTSPAPEVNQQIPNIRLSSADPVALSPTNSGTFKAGIWTGELRVLDPAANLTIKAGDSGHPVGSANPITVQVANDLALSALDSPDPVTAGQEVELVLRVDNSGPSVAQGVILNDYLPPQTVFLSASVSQGTFAVSNATVRCDLGTLPGGSNAIVSIRFNSGLATGILTNRAQVQRDEAELYSANDSVVLTTTVVPIPSITMDDAKILEGNSGRTNAVFLVRLSGPSSQTVSVNYTTADGTAQSGSDYTPASGRLDFIPGVTLLPLPVEVWSDQTDERDETFSVNLSIPIHATLTRARATGTIIDDDGPQITIADGTVVEGNQGTRNCLFDIALSQPSPQTVTVDYVTSDGSAAAPEDYEWNYDSLEFAPGVTHQLISVVVKGDALVEPNERFYVTLLNPESASLGRKQGLGTIVNDDGLPGNVDHFEWEPIASPKLVNEAFAVTLFARDAFRDVVTNFIGRATLSGDVPHPDAAVGAGEVRWSNPMATYYEDARTQIIYLAGELGGPRRITALALEIKSAPGMTLNRWTIRMKPTALSRYEAGAGWQSDGWTQVYQANEAITSSGWRTFQFQTPFEFDGVSNLLIDFSFNNRDYSFDEGECAASSTAEARALSGVADSEFGDPLNWSGLTAEPEVIRSILNLRLLWRDPVALTPTAAEAFVQGVWTGAVTVKELVSGMVLRADDGTGHLGQSAPFSTGLVDDLALTMTATPSPITVDRQLVYTLTAQNSGPAAANGVVISNRWPDGAALVSAQSSLGTWRTENGAVIFELGTLPGESNAVVLFTVHAPSNPGILINRATITRLELEKFDGNNSVVLRTPVYLRPVISVSDILSTEGNSGTSPAQFEVRLSNPSSDPVSIDYGLADGTAQEGLDYLGTSGTVIFPPGTLSQFIPVQILGDTLDEADELFYLNLTNAVNGTVLKNQVVGQILDDDGPAILMKAISVLEGDSGTTTATFSLRLTAPSPQRITIQYSTTDETATADSDYQAAAGTVTFPPGSTNQTLGITILGDILIEPDETFIVNLTDPVNATVPVSAAVGIILNEDGLPGRLDHFEWSPVSSPQYANQPFPVIVWAKDAAGQTVTNFADSAPIEGRMLYPEATIGTGTASWEAPFDTTYDMVRVQAIYLAAEVGPARPITSVALNVVDVPSLPLQRWMIRMKHTPRSAYPDLASWERTGWTTVYQANQTIQEPGWNTFELSRPFLFNGTNQLMIDFSFMNTSSTFKFGSCAASDTTEARCLAQGGYLDWGELDPLRWSGQSPTPEVSFQVPDLRLTALESIRIAPTNSDRFADGQWSGSLAVAQPFPNVILRISDALGRTGTGSPFQVLHWLDTDGDGLPDDWEIAHQFSATDPTNGTTDADGDGLTNLAEFAAGTDPGNAQSSLRIGTTLSRTGEVLLSFPTEAGKIYQIESCRDLNSGVWEQFGQAIASTGEVTGIVASLAWEQQVFLRLRLLLAP